MKAVLDGRVEFICSVFKGIRYMIFESLEISTGRVVSVSRRVEDVGLEAPD